MFQNKITCSNCHERIDALNIDCPNCHTHNFEYDKLKLSKHAFNVSFIWQLVLFFVGWMGLQIIASIVQIFFVAFSRVPIAELSENANLLGPIEFITYFLEAFIMIGLVILSKNAKNFIKPFKSFDTYVFGVIAFVIMYAVSTGYGNFVVPSDVDTSGNQQLVISITLANPLLSIIVLGILGPLCEELTYRVGLFGFLRRWNRVLAYLIGTFFFAIIHFDLEVILEIIQYQDFSGLIRELWNFPSYLIGGIGLVATYDLFGFGASSLAHMLNNLYGIMQILIVYGRK